MGVRHIFVDVFHTPLACLCWRMNTPGGRKIGVLMSSDTLGVLYAFPQNESPKHVAPFIDWWPADR